MKKIFAIIIFFVLSGNIYSQNQFFNDSLYLEQIEAFMSPIYKTHAETVTEIERLKENWNSGFIEDLKFGIVYISNTMKETYLNPFPFFYNYIATLNALILKQDLDYYREWEVGFLEILLSKKLPKINTFLETSKLLINDSILFQNKSITWKVLSTNYVIGNNPETQTLYVNFNSDIDLFCFNTKKLNRDTISVVGTKGVFFPTQKIFKGEYGRVFWDFENISPEKVFAKFKNYELNLNQGKFFIEDVAFTNEYVDLYQIPGSLSVRLVNNNSKVASPVFESYNSLVIQNIFPDVDFHGHIRMKGQKLFGIGKDQRASIYIRDKNKNIATIRSNNFELQLNKLIYSGSANFSMYLNNHLDSIYHNNIEVRYLSKLNNTLFRPRWFGFNAKEGNFLVVSRENNGSSGAPLKDTYHNFDIYSDKFVWAKSDSLVYFVTTMGSDQDFLNLKSDNYFDQDLFKYFSGRGTDNVNHFVYIRDLYDSLSKINEPITIKLYQKKLRERQNQQLSSKIIEKLFQKLSYANFVNYNRDLKIITPTTKLFDYISNNSRIKRHDTIYKDFDRIIISSRIGKPESKGSNIGVNAILDLSTNDLLVKRISNFWLSSSVKIITNEVLIQENRKLIFSGIVGAGLLKLSGTKFEYDYSQNNIKVLDPNTKMNLWYIDTLDDGRLSYFPISTSISNITGTLQINLPNDKSNTLNNIEYPKFVSSNNSKIYYNEFVSKYSQQDDSTGADNFEFYFDAENFYLDSLSYLTKNALNFKGTIHTGLFDPLPVTYTVRQGIDSNYLGFEECTGTNQALKEGLEFKGGKFYGCFILNDDGLYGKGFISYYSANVFSQNFVFLPGRVYAEIDSTIIDTAMSILPSVKENIPIMTGKNLTFDWKDNMEFNYNPKFSDNYISIYKNKLKKESIFIGSIVYNKNKMIGNGTFVFEDAELVDTGFVFKANSFDAYKCDFNLKQQKSVVFVTKNLNGHVDINKELGSFYSNDDTSRIYFKENNYMCIMDHFLWKIGEGIVNIGGVMPGRDSTDYVTSVEQKIEKKKDNNEIKLFGTILVNTVDTLKFNAAATTYDINQKILIAQNVKSLKIADAMIYPQGKVKIFKGGIMDTLKNISFEFPYKTFSVDKKQDYLHKFYDATVIIKNRYNYTSILPKYHYPYRYQIIEFDKAFTENSPRTNTQLLSMNPKELASISSNATKITRTDDSLRLNEHFVYYGNGDVKIYANKKYPYFRGFSKLDSTCNNKKIPLNFYKLSTIEVNPDTVKMPFSYDFPSQFGTVNSGLYWTIIRKGPKKVYTIRHPFIGRLKDAKSWDIFKPQGQLYYNEKSGEYRIAPEDLLYSTRADTISGNLMAYNKNLCLLRAQGTFNIFMNWDVTERINIDHIKSTVKGYYRYNLFDEIESFQVAMAFDFIAPEPIMKSLADNILANPDNQSIFDKKKERTIRNYNVFLGKDTTAKIIDEIENYFEYNMPPVLKHTIMFSDVNMVFNSDSSFLASEGEIGISNIDGIKVDRYIKGYIKYRLHPKTRMLLIILEPSPGIIYGFKYRYSDRGVMKFYTKTGSQAIDLYFDHLKTKDKKFKNNYEISESDENEFKAFAKEYFIKR